MNLPDNPLFNEAVSNYIVLAITFITAFITWLITRVWYWRKRSKPSVIEVERVNSLSLLEISADAKERIKVTYKEEEVESFYQTTFEVRNTGEHPLENIDIYILYHNEFTRLDPVFSDPLIASRQSRMAIEEKSKFNAKYGSLKISLPFINNEKEHHDEVILQVYSPEPFVVENVLGGGLGWSVNYQDTESFNKRMAQATRDVGTNVLVAALQVVPIIGPILESFAVSLKVNFSEPKEQT